MSLFISIGIVVSFLTLVQSGPKSDQTPKDFYERGLAQRKVGKWEQALKTWWDGSITLEADGLADPRIGVAFIELATEMQASSYYKRACDLYFKSLSSEDSKEYAEIVTQEFLSIANLLEDKEYQELNMALKRGEVSAVAERIERFWQEKNQPPTTQGNQKLLLHWLRIAYARQNFTKNTDSVYGTDDRGVVYIMNGEPAKRDWGRLFPKWRDGALARETNSTLEFEAWIYSSTKFDTSSIFLFGKDGRRVDSHQTLVHDKPTSYLLLPFETPLLTYPTPDFLASLRHHLLSEMTSKDYKVFDYFQYEQMLSVLGISGLHVTPAQALEAAKILHADAVIFCRVTNRINVSRQGRIVTFGLNFSIEVINTKNGEIHFSTRLNNHDELESDASGLAHEIVALVDRSRI